MTNRFLPCEHSELDSVLWLALTKLKYGFSGWRDGLVLKITCWAEFRSKYPSEKDGHGSQTNQLDYCWLGYSIWCLPDKILTQFPVKSFQCNRLTIIVCVWNFTSSLKCLKVNLAGGIALAGYGTFGYKGIDEGEGFWNCWGITLLHCWGIILLWAHRVSLHLCSAHYWEFCFVLFSDQWDCPVCAAGIRATVRYESQGVVCFSTL